MFEADREDATEELDSTSGGRCDVRTATATTPRNCRTAGRSIEKDPAGCCTNSDMQPLARQCEGM
jgi:hypothetical protein